MLKAMTTGGRLAEVDPGLARVYDGSREYTYTGPGDEWEVDDGDSVGQVRAADVVAAVGRRAVRLAVRETADPRAAAGLPS